MEFLIEILRKDPNAAYDYIAKAYYTYSKIELADIIKELLYAIYHEAEWGLITTEDHNKILANAADGLEGIYGDEIELDVKFDWE